MNFRYAKCAGCSLLFAAALLASPYPQTGGNQSSSADNTKVNKRDRSQSEPTADNAKNGTNDRELMRQIRHDVVADKSLSTYAHNVKIVAQGGKVTLKGVVHTEEEKKTIEDLARKHAGESNVTDEITIKGDSNKAESK
ncbi:MAG: BON domain-containing protein [Bryobacteraceae bacterium]